MRSALAQTGIDPARLELVIADNDATDSARAAVMTLARQSSIPIRYVHEPRPGVANVRNAALGVAGGDLIAFLDDDEEAPPAGWRRCSRSCRRTAPTWCSVRCMAARRIPGWRRAYLEHFFSRIGPAATGPTGQYWGCGNSLVRRTALPDPHRPFDESRNHTGGEDDLLFGRMQEAGAVYAWAAEAFVWEDPLPERLTLAYALRRAFAYGQGGSIRKVRRSPIDLKGLAFSMASGLGQALVFGAASAAAWIVRSPRRAFTYDRAARGLGKLLWWKAFHTHFYGAGLDAQPGCRARARRQSPLAVG